MKKYSLSQRCRERDVPVSRITIHCSPKFSGVRMIRVLEDLHRYTSFNYIIDKDGNMRFKTVRGLDSGILAK